MSRDAESGTATAGAVSALLAEIVASPDRRPPAPWERLLRPGARIGRFELLRELGRGGFGVVFEARDLELARRVAFKAIRPGERSRDPASESLLRSEATAVAQLQHPGIVTLFDAGRSEAGPYLIFELLHGETLASRLVRGRLSAREALRIGAAVGRALVHAHAHGVLHRDLKPSNVFLTADGSVKVLDFGLAHVFGAGGPAGSGTPGYMAPEQRRGEPEDARTDVHAAGALLSEMVGLGAPPLAGPNAPEPARVPKAVADLALRCTSEEPANRPPDAAALVAEMETIRAALERPLGPLTPAAPGPDPASPNAVEALRHFFRGEQCMSRPILGQDCAAEYRRAVALDPTLAVAHYQLAMWARSFGGTVADQKAAIALAVRHQHRAPPAEQLLIRALAADLDGDGDEAMALLREATERWPEDRRAFYEMADLLRHQDELELAVPYLERTVALDSGSGSSGPTGWAPGQLAEVLGALGRIDALRGWLARWERAPSSASFHAISIAHGWLGDAAAAAAAARRGLGLGSGLVAQQDLLGALVFAGRYAEAEETARAFAEPGSPVRRIGYWGLAALDAYRGRAGAGAPHLDALAQAIPEIERDAQHRAIRADLLLGTGDPAAVRAEADALMAIDPRLAAELAPSLAWLGDLDASEKLARGLRPGSVLARTHEALALWQRGGGERALDLLAGVAADGPVTVWRVAPLYLYADLAERAGRLPDAAAALERLERLYLPRMMWRSWAHGRALLGLARCRAALGDAPRARGALDLLLAERDAAPPSDPMVREALALRARLGG